ncbi:NAD-dependent epimerase/dehydratase family protein [bacterium]|nr:NAD-dependent epimerase/dehydratase family protein [bacterium]
MNKSEQINLSRETSFFIVGGAGFIGSHFIDVLLARPEVKQVSVFDNFSSGKEWHYQQHKADSRLRVFRGDVKDLSFLTQSMSGHGTVIHLASNPDIARAASEPDIDFREGTLLTNNVLEAMRVSKTSRLLYASGSGVYGDLGEFEAYEDFGPMHPISTYGASKLAGEAMISSYCFMFDIFACAFRFANVVGPRQTHGVGFDFVRRLLKNPTELRILGDGTQSKSYAHVSDIVSGVLIAGEKQTKRFDVYNICTGDYISVAEIADLAVECCGLTPDKVTYQFTGGDRGWKGDVPIIRMNSDRIRKIGWSNKMNGRQALKASMMAMIDEIRAN